MTPRFPGRAWVALAFGLTLAAPAAADEPTRWNQLATDALAAAKADPITESRTLAMVQVAVHDALNAIDRRYAPHTATLPLARDASPEAAVAAAAHAVLVELLPAGKAGLDAALSETTAALPEGPGRDRGLAVGRGAAAAILLARRDDGATRTATYRPSGRAGDYRPTPPDLTPAWMVQWGEVKPFVLRSGSQFRSPAPPRPDGSQARAEVEELRRFGGAEGSERNDEQSEIARYWYEWSTQSWNRIAREVVTSRRLDPWESARLYALVNLAMADATIAAFESKYHHHFWRPASAVRAAGHDGWLSYLPTPPVPDHPSNHAAVGAAAATVMARLSGTDLVPFQMTSGAPYPGITRRFWSLSEAARENAASRVLAGLHFPSAVRDGYAQGEAVGRFVCENALRPEPARTTASR
jgi:hypothetical protein